MLSPNESSPSRATRQPLHEAVAAPTKEIQAGINARFREEVQRIFDAGFARTPTHMGEHLGLTRHQVQRVMDAENFTAKLPLIRRLRDVYNGDYHYILFGQRHPDLDKRALKKPAGKLSPDALSLADLQSWMDYRFIKEVERMEREGRAINRQWIGDKIGLHRTMFQKLREGVDHVQAYHVVLLKQTLNADYHFILWGIDRSDISMPAMFKEGRGTVRIDVFEPYLINYKGRAAKWGACIPPRDPEDDVKRLNLAGYYLDLPIK